jgi:hypothetical protein
MKILILLALICLSSAIQIHGQPYKSEEYKSGLIYGKNNAYFLNAPDGWILDNQSGVKQGLYAVFYPKGSTWQNSIGMMYSKAITKDSIYNSIDSYIRIDLNNLKNEAPDLKAEFKSEIKINKTKKAQIYEWSGDNYGNIESTAYIDEKNVIVLISYSCRDTGFYNSNYSKFIQTVKSYSFVTEKVTIEK